MLWYHDRALHHDKIETVFIRSKVREKPSLLKPRDITLRRWFETAGRRKVVTPCGESNRNGIKTDVTCTWIKVILTDLAR